MSEPGLAFRTKKFAVQALLDKAAGVVPSKDSVPVLKNFHVEAADGKLRIAATDLELSVIASTAMVTVDRPGRALLPAGRLIQIVREAEDGELHLDVSDRVGVVQVGRTKWTLTLQDEAEYPELPDIGSTEMQLVDREKFLNALKSVRYAASSDTVRANLMIVDVRKGQMRASDGTRFQQASIGDFPMDVQIPIAATDDLVKSLQSTDTPTIALGEDENHLIFRIGGDHFIARKLTVEFPDMEEQLLKPVLSNDQELQVSRNELIQAIKQVRITADQETSAVTLSLKASEADGSAKMVVASRDKYDSQAETELDVSWSGADRTVALNHQHLLAMLAMTRAKSCSFFLGPDKKKKPSPILLRDVEAGTLGVLSQTRVDWTS